MKKSTAAAALDLGVSPRPKVPSGAVTSASASASYSAAAAAGAMTMGRQLAAALRYGLWRISKESDAALSRFLAYLDLVSAGQVTWKCFFSDARSVAQEAIDECSACCKTMASRTRRAGVEAAALSVRFMGMRLHGTVKTVLGDSYLEHARAVARRLGPIVRFLRFVVRSCAVSAASAACEAAGKTWACARGFARGDLKLGNALAYMASAQERVIEYLCSSCRSLQRVLQGQITEHLDELDRRLAGVGLEQEMVPGDGNCFYHALVIQLERAGVPVEPVATCEKAGDASDSEDGRADEDEVEASDEDEERGGNRALPRGYGSSDPAYIARAVIVDYMEQNPTHFQAYLSAVDETCNTPSPSVAGAEQDGQDDRFKRYLAR